MGFRSVWNCRSRSLAAIFFGKDTVLAEVIAVITWLGAVCCAWWSAACTSNAQSSDFQYNGHQYTGNVDRPSAGGARNSRVFFTLGRGTGEVSWSFDFDGVHPMRLVRS